MGNFTIIIKKYIIYIYTYPKTIPSHSWFMTSGWWLSHPSEKYEFFSWDYGIPSVWTVIKFMFQSTNQHIYLEQPQARIWAWMCLGFFFCLTLEFSPESKFLPERVFYIFAKDFCSLNCSKSFPRQFSPDSRVFPPDSRVFPPELENTKTQKYLSKQELTHWAKTGNSSLNGQSRLNRCSG